MALRGSSGADEGQAKDGRARLEFDAEHRHLNTAGSGLFSIGWPPTEHRLSPLDSGPRRCRSSTRRRFSELTLRDEQRLRRQAHRLRRGNEEGRARFEQQLAEARARVQRRRASVPEVSYPPQLPVSARHDDLLAAIRDHQVVVVAGETGSGKTTQLPKLCLELGRGVRGAIAHTQPRRLAARTVAQRIADELDVPLGGAVGYAVRFDDRGSEDTLGPSGHRRPAARRDPP